MESIKDRSTLNWTTDDRGRRTTRRRGATLMALFFAMGLISVSAFAQTLPITATRFTDTNTNPRGAAFLSDANGGHWWVADSVNGICEATALGGNPVPPFTIANGTCQGAVKAGGQFVVVTPTAAEAASFKVPANGKFVFVPDFSAVSTTVVRFIFNPAGNGSLSGAFPISVPNVGKGGRSVAIAVTPHKGVAANGGSLDMYVGYIKSGDIMLVAGIDNNTLSAPPISRVGTTSDAKGVNSLLFFGTDLYLGEIGGFGLSVISDPSGIARAACTATPVCAGISIGTAASALPGGLATDWVSGSTAGRVIYVGDAQRAVANSVNRLNPATGAVTPYSLNVTPGYNDQTNPAPQPQTFYTTYINPMGLGYNPANGDLLVGDDPQLLVTVNPATNKGHLWKISANARTPIVSSIAPATGSTAGGTRVTVTGTDLATYNAAGVPTVLPTITFGANNGTGVACANAAAPATNPTAGTCTVTAPAGVGAVDVRVTVAGQTSPIVAADVYTYSQASVVTVTSVTPASGNTVGGTLVTITGSNLAAYNVAGAVITVPAINFGGVAATNIICQPTATPVVLPVSSVCTATSPAHAAGVVDVQAVRGQSSAIVPADKFTYVAPVASLYAWGVSAPKGGASWLPGALGGHFWSSDESQGFCRQDLDSSAGAFTIAGSTLHAMNLNLCAPDIIGGAGQAAYDPSVIPGSTFHYVYIGDNQITGTTIWRLTFDPATESLVPDPFNAAMATVMVPLTNARHLRPNSLALGPDGSLYVASLSNSQIQKITLPSGDPRNQALIDVAITGDNRGANGTAGFIGNLLYIPGNRGAEFFDITKCPLAGGPCGMADIPAPTGIFVAGVATDAAHKLVYLTNSAGGAPASILRYDASTDVYVAFAPGFYPPDLNGVVTCTACTTNPAAATNYITGGLLPPIGTPNGTVSLALTGLRPWDQTNHPTAGIPAGSFIPAGFAFAFGIETDPSGNLVITEDPAAGARSGRGTIWTVPFVP